MASSRILPTLVAGHTKTYGDVTRDYQVGEMSVWESDTDIDLSIANSGEVLDCYDDAASFNESGIVIAGATNTNATRFRLIRAPVGQCHDGTPNNGFTISTTTNAIIIDIQETYAQIWDLIIIGAFNSASNYAACRMANPGNTGKYVGIIAKATNAGTGEGRGILINAVIINSMAINCLAYECKTYGFNILAASGITNRALNCTAINCGMGFSIGQGATAGTVVLTNCIGQDNASGDFISDGLVTENVTYCLSKDATADDWGGAGNLINKDLGFANEAGDDWHLASTDTDAINAGIDLSATFDDDIDFTVRASWDIGFDEYEVQSILPLVGFGTLGGNANPMMA